MTDRVHNVMYTERLSDGSSKSGMTVESDTINVYHHRHEEGSKENFNKRKKTIKLLHSKKSKS